VKIAVRTRDIVVRSQEELLKWLDKIPEQNDQRVRPCVSFVANCFTANGNALDVVNVS
jgi:hypothetical protein